MNARTRLERPIASVVTNTAPPPSVVMRILDRSGRDAQVVSLGDELILRVELKDPTSAFAIFARNLYARSSTGESLFLIDNTGCPTDPAIFPALKVDSRDQKSLQSTFKAFRFPSTGVVNFEVQIRFCQERCEPISCSSGTDSLGKRRKRDIHGYDNGDDWLREDVYRTDIKPILVPNDGKIAQIVRRRKMRSTTSENLQTTTLEPIATTLENNNIKNRSALMDNESSTNKIDEPITKEESSSDEPSSVVNVLPKPAPYMQPYTTAWPNSQNGFQHNSSFNPYQIQNPSTLYGHNSGYNFNPSLLPPPALTTHLPPANPLSAPFIPPYYSSNYGYSYPSDYHNYNNYPNRTQFWNYITPSPTSHTTIPPRSQTPHKVKRIETVHAPVKKAVPITTTNSPLIFGTKQKGVPIPPSRLEWGKSRPHGLPPRPTRKFSRENLQTPEIPLSLAIMVGDDKDPNWRQRNNELIRNRKLRKI